ncbi:MAG: zinc metallopeptidase [Bacteroidales bacterium]|nr:zinc metallopeptidase [Bacteroidales bacterium]
MSTGIIWIVFIVLMVVSLIVSKTLNRKIEKYSQEMIPSGLTGKEIAEKMLRSFGITDVKVQSVAGKLTDHYNPTDKTLNLSETTYNMNSIAAAAVAAHECGHAVQHAVGYKWLKMRSAMVPFVQFGSRWSQWILLAGMLLLGVASLVSFGEILLLIGIILFSLTTIFSFVTLPVEYNASDRALNWLETSGMVVGEQHDKAQDALKCAARTYVVAALSSLATLLYYLMILNNRRS